MHEKRPIYLICARTQYQLCATFLRFQEHYESPRFQGEIFSLETFMDWYAKENGDFTYFSDWNGFNFPSSTLTPFYEGKFDPLSKKESWLLTVLPGARSRYYVIGAIRGAPDNDIRHEYLHGLFYTVPRYRSKVIREIESHNLSYLHNALRASGYAPTVYIDETNAYLLSGLSRSIREHLKGLPDYPKYKEHMRCVRQRLARIFKEEFGCSITRLPVSVIRGGIRCIEMPASI